MGTPELTPSSWKFRFERGGSDASTGLSMSFSRDQQTIDPTGVVVSAGTGLDKARFERPLRVAPVPGPESALLNTSTCLVMASGYDADGSEELMVVLAIESGQSIYVFVDDQVANANTTALTQVTLGPSALNCPDPQPYCLSVQTDEDPILLLPRCATVFHGAIIIAGPVMIDDPEDEGTLVTYGGWAFAINRAEGDSGEWELLWEDDEPQQVNFAKGNLWCIKSCPVHEQRTPEPLGFWVVCTDYVGRTSTLAGCSGAEPTGGRVFVARMIRPDEDPPSYNWQIDHDPEEFMTFDFEDGVPLMNDLVLGGCHTHSAYILEYGQTDETDKRVQLIVSLGDGQHNNRIARLIWENESDDDFMEDWTLEGDGDNFHGRRTTSTALADRGSQNLQPVGVAGLYDVAAGDPSYHNPSLVWGCDVTSEWLVHMAPPTPASAVEQLSFSYLRGASTGFGSTRDPGTYPYTLVGTINEADPVSQLHWVASVNDARHAGNCRVLYHKGGVAGDLTAWYEVAAVRAENGVSAAKAFDSIWYAAYPGESETPSPGKGIFRVPIPNEALETAVQPIIVSPGGENLVHEDYVLDDNGNQGEILDQLSRHGMTPVRGEFIDDSWWEGDKTLPTCPTMAEHAYRVRTLRDDNTGDFANFITEVHVSSASDSTWNTLETEWAIGPRIRRYRAWVLDNSFNNQHEDNEELVGFAPNKTTQLSSEIMNVVLDMDQLPVLPNKPGYTVYSCRDRWIPFTFIAYHDFLDDSMLARALGMRLRSVWSGEAITPDDNDFYFVVDSAHDGYGSMPYPMLHDDGDGAVTEGSPELLTITASGMSRPILDKSQDWSVRIAGILPEGDWDQFAERFKDEGGTDPADRRYWPLFTLWADNDNYFEFRADCVNHGFEVKAVIGGSTLWRHFGDINQRWLPNSQFYALISLKRITSPSVGWRFHFAASLGGGQVAHTESDPINTPWPESDPVWTQLRFRGGPDASANNAETANEVVTMRWIGGEFLTGTGAAFDDESKLEDAFGDPDLVWMLGP